MATKVSDSGAKSPISSQLATTNQSLCMEHACLSQTSRSEDDSVRDACVEEHAYLREVDSSRAGRREKQSCAGCEDRRVLRAEETGPLSLMCGTTPIRHVR